MVLKLRLGQKWGRVEQFSNYQLFLKWATLLFIILLKFNSENSSRLSLVLYIYSICTVYTPFTFGSPLPPSRCYPCQKICRICTDFAFFQYQILKKNTSLFTIQKHISCRDKSFFASSCEKQCVIQSWALATFVAAT